MGCHIPKLCSRVTVFVMVVFGMAWLPMRLTREERQSRRCGVEGDSWRKEPWRPLYALRRACGGQHRYHIIYMYLNESFLTSICLSNSLIVPPFGVAIAFSMATAKFFRWFSDTIMGSRN